MYMCVKVQTNEGILYVLTHATCTTRMYLQHQDVPIGTGYKTYDFVTPRLFLLNNYNCAHLFFSCVM